MRAQIVKALLVSILVMTPYVSSPLNAQVNFGIRIGPPPPPRVLHAIPRRPGPDFVWIEGYWYPSPNGRSYRWHSGYWTRPPFEGAYWVGPHYDGARFHEGYWEKNQQWMNHDHNWDRSRDRDYHR